MRGILHALEKQSSLLSRVPEAVSLVKNLQVRIPLRGLLCEAGNLQGTMLDGEVTRMKTYVCLIALLCPSHPYYF